MKKLLIVPIVVAGLAGCAVSHEASHASPNVQPASQSLDKPFKMVKPKAPNGHAGSQHDMHSGGL